MAESKSKSGLVRLADAFDALTYKEMMECADVLVAALEQVNGLKVKDTAMAQALGAFGEFLDDEREGA